MMQVETCCYIIVTLLFLKSSCPMQTIHRSSSHLNTFSHVQHIIITEGVNIIVIIIFIARFFYLWLGIINF